MFAIVVHFALGAFDANANDALDAPEWPPHPGRLFSGLVSVAEEAGELAALEWLESLDPPTILASSESETTIAKRSNYVVTNEIDRKGRSHMELPARSGGGRRVWASRRPKDPNVSYQWGVEAAPTGHLDAIEDMCRRLPYLGRSTSPVAAWLDREARPPGADLDTTWVPDEDGDVRLTVPGPGYLQGLRDAYDDDQRPWVVARRWCRYLSPDHDVPEQVSAIAQPFRRRDWIVYRVANGRTLPYSSLIEWTSLFRSAAIAALGADVPAVLHGHRDGDDQPVERVMFVGLPFIGAQHADGHIMGFAVSVPKGLSDDERSSVYRSLVGVTELRHQRHGVVRLDRTDLGTSQTLDPSTWAKASTRWVTAYPAVLDRWVRKASDIAPTIAAMCGRVGLPEPVKVDWATTPLTAGPDRLLPRHTVRRSDQPKHKYFHVRLTFAEQVAGPIVLGHMRHFGLGLMKPERVADEPGAGS